MEISEGSESWKTISMEGVEGSQSGETISLTASKKHALFLLLMIALFLVVVVLPLVTVFCGESVDVNFCMNETLVY
jgi:hypothetical protein